jgi:ATP-dependent RNA helicase DDX19/DBP5
MASNENSSSLESRITQPPSTLNPASSSFTPGAATETKTSWADDVESPVTEKPEVAGGLGAAQVDGSTEPLGGSALHDGEHEVVVKLADIQGDESSPLHSIKSFDELGM